MTPSNSGTAGASRRTHCNAPCSRSARMCDVSRSPAAWMAPASTSDSQASSPHTAAMSSERAETSRMRHDGTPAGVRRLMPKDGLPGDGLPGKLRHDAATVSDGLLYSGRSACTAQRVSAAQPRRLSSPDASGVVSTSTIGGKPCTSADACCTASCRRRHASASNAAPSTTMMPAAPSLSACSAHHTRQAMRVRAASSSDERRPVRRPACAAARQTADSSCGRSSRRNTERAATLATRFAGTDGDRPRGAVQDCMSGFWKSVVRGTPTASRRHSACASG